MKQLTGLWAGTSYEGKDAHSVIGLYFDGKGKASQWGRQNGFNREFEYLEGYYAEE